MRLRSSSTAWRRISSLACSDSRLWCSAIVACRATASVSARRQPVSQASADPADSAIQPSVPVGSRSGTTTSDSTPIDALCSRTGAGSRGSCPEYSIVSVQPAVSASRCASMLSRSRASCSQPMRVPAEELAPDVGHPELAARLVVAAAATRCTSGSRSPRRGCG